jgi:type IV pilus assembly protein PilN
MKLTTNLATRRYVNLRQLDILLLLAFVLILGLAAFQVIAVAQNAAEMNRVKGLARGGVPAGPQVSAAQLQAQAKQVAFANDLIDRKTVDWLTLLDRLEEVVPSGVSLNEIQPDRNRVLKIGGMVRQFDSLRVLMENMERSRYFTDVYLVSQAQAKVGLTQEGINFQISCRIAQR